MTKSNNGRHAYYRVEPPAKKRKGITVIFYHGWGTAAESYLDFAETIAGEGYAVILPELAYHDTRNPLENPFRQEIVQDYFWKTIFESIDEAEAFMDELGVPASKIVVAGSSMGGFIAAGIGAQQQHLGGSASINGSGSFRLTEKLFRERDQRPALSPEEEQLWKKYDPAEWGMPSAPVLLLHGKDDQTIPPQGQLHYYRYLTEKCRHQHTEFKLYDGVNHQFTTEMVADFVDWLNRCAQNGLIIKEVVSPYISREIKELLGYATSFSRIEAEYNKYLQESRRKLYSFQLEGNIMGCIGVEWEKDQMEIKHIAVLPEGRGKHIGSRMIESLRNKHSPNVIVAETDQESVEFYRKTGFAVASLGEKYPGVERFWCERKEG